MIELSNISKEVLEAGTRIPILNRINLSIHRGEFVSIMGPSGSGKSSLMNILGSLDVPTSGDYLFEGTNIQRLGGKQLADFRNQRLGFVFQSFMLIPRLSVKDNVEVPLLYSTYNKKERKRRIKEALEQVGMIHKAKEPIINLSGGQKQKIAIARAIINDPDLLLIDEPSGNLDAASKEEVLEIFLSLNDRGKTIVLVTHDQEVARIGKRILILKNGEWFKPEKGEQ
ncbi:ABC transporter ATP-binding protein [Paenibacillus radicis (ex Xue et al. 2023)]|uniref:ABC transporter ATP-binding protein n=1 Tax=Paenibacillus radicis (ex Xue et al. 2023) TaxID=2972489 RepID=A0ABT1YGU2_9BACL|nr:ABC transporter ATP-binding protein [Paenibacillus radicis (ex Xue et al. 2023)]MCR8632418.1 ABC transporter ATP-binding protein [Paenibacillus radicis (ex Xue et al. 2023)]